MALSQEFQRLSRLNEDLVSAKQRLLESKSVRSKLQDLESRVRTYRTKTSELAEIVASEQADVDKLEGTSLTGLFLGLLGNKQERVEQEREELLAAKLKHDSAVEELENLEQQAEAMRGKWLLLENAQRDYESVLAEKEQWLTNQANADAEKLIEASELLAEWDAQIREIEEAIKAGEKARSSLGSVRTQLGSAANWGTWDMLGGGAVSTWIKHSKIDDAKQSARQAQMHLHQFQTELADVNRELKTDLDIGSLTRFADWFFDGLIMDWMVQSKIKKAQSSCQRAIDAVDRALGSCKKELQSARDERDGCENARKEFIESVGISAEESTGPQEP